MSAKIQKIKAREILDCRGLPTLEVKAWLDDDIYASASVPASVAPSEHEAKELRDGDVKRYNGLGVSRAMQIVNNEINKALKGIEATDQQKIDETLLVLDGTEDKSKLGVNTIYGVSVACARVVSAVSGIPLHQYLKKVFRLEPAKIGLPVPMINTFNGGRYADTNLDFQEFMLVPLGVKGGFKEMVRAGSEVFQQLGLVLRERGFDTDTGLEGGYAPDMTSSVQAVEFMEAAIRRAGYKLETEMGIAIDIGSSRLFDLNQKQYIFKLDQAAFSTQILLGLYYEWFRKYPIVALEDGLEADGWAAWRELTKELGEEIMVVGDDVFAGRKERLERGIREKAANAVIVKPAQIGALAEIIDYVKLAQKHNYKIVVSQRSSETNDDFIADLAVAVGADYIKAGSLTRGERVAKYNRLLEIEEEMG